MPAPPLDLNSLALPDLYRYFADTGLVRRLLELARDEDLGVVPPDEPRRAHHAPPGDITTDACIDPGRTARAQLVARAGGVIAGLAAIPDLLKLFAPGCRFAHHHEDGSAVEPRTTIATLDGPLDEILEVERTMLNLVGRLSGVASRADSFRKAMGPDPSRARLYDTRKTTPGMRVLEKYAVRCGGGFCHRIGLYDAVLIKDNHLAGVPVSDLARFVQAAADKARSLSARPLAFVEVEADSLEQFEALLTLAPSVIDIVLLDNMTPDQLRLASGLRERKNSRLQLEASGGVTLDTIREIAQSGVDRISVGALTHSAVSLDVALDVV